MIQIPNSPTRGRICPISNKTSQKHIKKPGIICIEKLKPLVRPSFWFKWLVLFAFVLQVLSFIFIFIDSKQEKKKIQRSLSLIEESLETDLKEVPKWLLFRTLRSSVNRMELATNRLRPHGVGFHLPYQFSSNHE
jgi:hypothetical protein